MTNNQKNTDYLFFDRVWMKKKDGTLVPIQVEMVLAYTLDHDFGFLG